MELYRHIKGFSHPFFCTATPQEACIMHPELIDPVAMLYNAAKYLGDNYRFNQEADTILRDAWESI